MANAARNSRILLTPLSPVADLTCHLVRCRSLTPDDAGVQDVLGQLLTPLGFVARDCSRRGVRNTWWRWGDQAPVLCFAGHSDVVPPGDQAAWRYDPFAATVADDMIWGRGTADMKGSLAAMAVALQRAVVAAADRPLQGSLALLVTSDEEGPARDGTVAVMDDLQQRGEHIDYCVVGEPSCSQRLGDTMRVGRRGSLSLDLTLTGVQGHVAYPHLADNAVHLALPLLNNLCAEQWDQGDDDFPPTTMQIVSVRAGAGAGNIIPGRVEITINWRHGMASPAASITERVEQLLAQCEGPHQVQLHWTVNAPPFRAPPGRLRDEAVRIITEVCGAPVEANCAGGTSDGRFIAPTGSEVIEFGPCNGTIHQANECVNLNDLEQLSEVYYQLIGALLTK